MAITQIGAFTKSATTATNPAVVSTPAGAASGDLLVFFVGFEDNLSATITPPAGASAVPGTRIDHANVGDDDLTTVIYTLQLSGSPAANYTFSTSPSSPFGLGVSCVCLRGVDSTTPVDTKSINNGHTINPIATGVTITHSNEWLFIFYLGAQNSLINTNFPSFTFLFTTDSGGNDTTYASFASGWAVGVIQNIASGATGNFTATLSVSDDWAATLVAFQPSQFAVLPTDALFFGMT